MVIGVDAEEVEARLALVRWIHKSRRIRESIMADVADSENVIKDCLHYFRMIIWSFSR